MTKQHNQDEPNEELAVRAGDLVRAGQLDEAEALLQRLPSGIEFSGWLHEKASALIRLASQRAERGESKRAIETLHEALAACSGLRRGGTWEEADCLLQVGAVFQKLGRHGDAIDVWMQAGARAQAGQDRDVDCLKILSQLARDLARCGERNRALELAQSIGVEEIRSRTLADIG